MVIVKRKSIHTLLAAIVLRNAFSRKEGKKMNMQELGRFLADGQREDFRTCETPPCCEAFTHTCYAVPMRDGIRMETHVWLPEDGTEIHPVILTRTCYPHFDLSLQVEGEELARRGYAFVYQYCRGQMGSEGDWKPNIYEREDGIDTVMWIYAQPWVGRIGVWGRSYSALTGWAMADAVTGIVSSMFLGAYGTDRFLSAYQKGSFRHDVLTSWTMENAGFAITADYEESCLFRPQEEVDELLWGGRIDWYRDYILNEEITDDYWQSGWWKQLREIPGKTRIPIFITSGWYDHHHGSSMVTWERLNPEAKAHSWLEVSAQNHFQQPCLEDRVPSQDPKSELDSLFDWFGRTLVKGKLPAQRRRFYEINADRWYDTDAGNFPNSSDDSGSGLEKVWYLQTGKAGERRLGPEAGEAVSAQSYIYDPQNPVRTHGADAMLHYMREAGSLRQPPSDWRGDVLSFLSDPLTEDLDIFGKLKVKLWVRSDCEDTAFTAKLSEVSPEGTAYHIRSSITRLAVDQPGGVYTPGEAAEVEVEMWEIFYQVKAGWRLRLDISSSDFPQYHVHANFPGKWARQTETRIANQTILCGGEYPSRVVIPLLRPESGR